jgi:hypothetical protein
MCREVSQHQYQPLLDDLEAGQRLAELAPLLLVPQGGVVSGGEVAQRCPCGHDGNVPSGVGGSHGE